MGWERKGGETTNSQKFLCSGEMGLYRQKRDEWKLVVEEGFFFSWLRSEHMYVDLRTVCPRSKIFMTAFTCGT